MYSICCIAIWVSDTTLVMVQRVNQLTSHSCLHYKIHGDALSLASPQIHSFTSDRTDASQVPGEGNLRNWDSRGSVVILAHNSLSPSMTVCLCSLLLVSKLNGVIYKQDALSATPPPGSANLKCIAHSILWIYSDGDRLVKGRKNVNLERFSWGIFCKKKGYKLTALVS